MFELLFCQKHRHSGVYINLLDAPHCLLPPATPATTIINTLLDFPNAYQCVYILLKYDEIFPFSINKLQRAFKGLIFYIIPPVCKCRDMCIKLLIKSQLAVHILSMILC